MLGFEASITTDIKSTEPFGAEFVQSDFVASFGDDKGFPASVEQTEGFGAVFGEVYRTGDIPSNYGLITWNGSILTVS